MSDLTYLTIFSNETPEPDPPATEEPDPQTDDPEPPDPDGE